MSESDNQQNDQETISGTKAGAVHASTVNISQASVDQITTERASIRQASVKQLDTRTAQFDQSSVFRMKADSAVLTQSAATFVDARDVRLVKCNALVVKGKTNAVEGDLKAVIHVGEATGNVHTIFDKEGALRFGVGLGAALVTLSVAVRKLFR